MAKAVRKCLQCGKTFELSKYNSRKKYCSQKCSQKANFIKKHKYDKVCPTCKKQFKAMKDQIYCSSECWINKNGPKKPKDPRTKGSLEKICLWCHTKFKSNTPQLYCSLECGVQYRAMLQKIFKKHPFGDTLKLRLELQEKGKNFVLR
jgi:hypothetical protein